MNTLNNDGEVKSIDSISARIQADVVQMEEIFVTFHNICG